MWYNIYIIIKEEDSQDSEASQTNKELRHKLLEEQMRHEQLKHAHRESMTKLEQFELEIINQKALNIHVRDAARKEAIDGL